MEALKHQRTNARSSTKKRVGTQQEEAGGAEQPAGTQDELPPMNIYASQVKNKNKQIDKKKTKPKRAFYKFQVNANLHFQVPRKAFSYSV